MAETTARGAVYTAPETIEIREFPLPEVGAEDMLVEVQLAGVDGSDIHMLRGELPEFNDLAPVIMGDEIVGEIAKIGDEAAAQRGLAVGDRVIVEAKWPCHDCDACRSGQYYACE